MISDRIDPEQALAVLSVTQCSQFILGRWAMIRPWSLIAGIFCALALLAGCEEPDPIDGRYTQSSSRDCGVAPGSYIMVASKRTIELIQPNITIGFGPVVYEATPSGAIIAYWQHSFTISQGQRHEDSGDGRERAIIFVKEEHGVLRELGSAIQDATQPVKTNGTINLVPLPGEERLWFRCD